MNIHSDYEFGSIQVSDIYRISDFVSLEIDNVVLELFRMFRSLYSFIVIGSETFLRQIFLSPSSFQLIYSLWLLATIIRHVDMIHLYLGYVTKFTDSSNLFNFIAEIYLFFSL